MGLFILVNGHRQYSKSAALIPVHQKGWQTGWATLVVTVFLPLVAIEPVVEEDPCNPNPCGPNSQPPVNRNYGGSQCQCKCLPDMIGSPPNCRPECYLNSDCSPDKACISRKCQDPCPGLCGVNAVCRVRNLVPICVCNPGYEGDPFSQCFIVTSKSFL